MLLAGYRLIIHQTPPLSDPPALAHFLLGRTLGATLGRLRVLALLAHRGPGPAHCKIAEGLREPKKGVSFRSIGWDGLCLKIDGLWHVYHCIADRPPSVVLQFIEGRLPPGNHSIIVFDVDLVFLAEPGKQH